MIEAIVLSGTVGLSIGALVGYVAGKAETTDGAKITALYCVCGEKNGIIQCDMCGGLIKNDATRGPGGEQNGG